MTPGKWKVVDLGGTGNLYVFSEDDKPICGPFTEKRHGDARAIAQLPELVEAAKALIYTVRDDNEVRYLKDFVRGVLEQMEDCVCKPN